MFHGDFHQETDHLARCFAAQMALASSVAPAGDALVGTLIQKDRFNNKSGQHRFILRTENEDGSITFRSNHVVHAFQLLINQPGPGFLSIAAAIASGHGGMVQQFFYMN